MLPKVLVGTAIILYLVSNIVAHTTGIRRVCTSNKQCDKDKYCYNRFTQDTCIQCCDCERVNRQYIQDGCPHLLTQCGPCKVGLRVVCDSQGSRRYRAGSHNDCIISCLKFSNLHTPT